MEPSNKKDWEKISRMPEEVFVKKGQRCTGQYHTTCIQTYYISTRCTSCYHYQKVGETITEFPPDTGCAKKVSPHELENEHVLNKLWMDGFEDLKVFNKMLVGNPLWRFSNNSIGFLEDSTTQSYAPHPWRGEGMKLLCCLVDVDYGGLHEGVGSSMKLLSVK